jgi:hypothetical protein
MTAHNPAGRADDYDRGAGWDRVADAMDKHGAAAVLADPGLVADPPGFDPWADWGGEDEPPCGVECGCGRGAS